MALSETQKRALQFSELPCALRAAYDERGKIGDRIPVDVSEALVGETSITSMALIIHELATNSIKYGSLSSATGMVGSRLVHTSITGQQGESITFEWPAEGAVVTLGVSKARLGA